MALDIQQIEEELEELESRIDRLRALYEQYFMGIEKLEPQIPRKDVERRIHALRKEKLRNTGQRFRFQMLAQRYNTLQQHWGRVVREIEKGTYRRGVARGAQRLGTAEPLTDLARRRQERYAALAAAQAEREHARHPPPAEPIEEPHAPEPLVAPQPAAAAPPPPRPPPLSPGLGLFFRGAPAVKPAAPQGQAHAPAPVVSTAPSSSLDGARRAAALAAGLKAQRAAQQTAPREPLGLALDAHAATPAPARAVPSPSSPRVPPPRVPPPRVPPPRVPPPTPASTSVTQPPALQRSAVPAAAAPLPPHRPRPAASGPPAPTSSPNDQARTDMLPEGRVRQIYNQYVDSRRAANESTAGLTYDKLARTLEAQTAKLRASHATRSVDFEVAIKNGRTVLKPVLR